jgi:cob(I)alamin adenosyltransferase
MAKVTTGTGDTGYTGLLGEQQVPKYDPRPDTFGTVDEATSALGLARAATKDQNVKEMILAIQQDLYLLMAELATPPENYEKIGYRVTAEHVHRLKQREEALKREVKIPNTFRSLVFLLILGEGAG